MPTSPFFLPPVLPGDFRRTFPRDPLGVLTRMAGAAYPVVTIRLGLRRLTLLNEPTLIEAMLIAHQADVSHAPPPRILQRRIGAGPDVRLFGLDLDPTRLAELAPQIAEATLRHFGAWPDGETTDLRETMEHLAADLADLVHPHPPDLADALGSCLAFAADLLGRHPTFQNRLYVELGAILGEAPLDVDDLIRLPHAGRAFDEVLRCYPPVWAIFRAVPHPTVVLDHELPAGHLVVSPFTLHHDDRLWPTPDRFDPDRFMEWGTAKRPAMAYLPFGVDEKIRHAADFIRVIGTYVLAALAQRWQLRPAYDLTLPLQAGPFLRPAVPLPIVLHRRDGRFRV